MFIFPPFKIRPKMVRYVNFKVCFRGPDNGFSQIFCNYLNVDEIFSWLNRAVSLSQNVQQKF